MEHPSRRTFLAVLAAGRALSAAEPDRLKLFPSDQRRYLDPTTEFEVYRLTDPAYTSRLPAHYNHCVSRHGFLIYITDRAGSNQAFRMDLKTGESRQLTHAEALDPDTVALLPDDRGIVFFDGGSLEFLNLVNGRQRSLYEAPDGWKRTAGAALSGDGVNVVFAEANGERSRVMVAGTARGGATQAAEVAFVATHPQPRPRRAQILFRQGEQALWLVNFDGRQAHPLKTAAGTTGPAMWSPDGRTVLYLNFPDDRTQLNNLREANPDENTDKRIAPTSQFVHFGANGDSSVFIGASRNRGAPHLLLLLRMTRREFTLCEHKASDPAMTAPVFSPDSQRIFFTSDRHGKPCLYRVDVQRLVEKTVSDS